VIDWRVSEDFEGIKVDRTKLVIEPVTVKSSKKEAKLLKRLFWAQGDVKAARVAGVGVQGREMLSYAT
jgi:hypothetical protein